MLPVLFRLGPFEIESFWVMVILGFVAAMFVGREEIRRHGLDPRLIYDIVLHAYVGGLVGARLFLLFTAWDLFVEDPFNFLLSGSGWVWYGGLIGGAAAVFFLIWRQQLPVAAVADTAGVGLALGQAIGRIGCQLAGDGDYGVPTDLPWGMSYPNGTVPTTEAVHPTPIYETVLLVGVFLWLWTGRHRRAPGEGFGQYLVFAGIIRFAIEFVRTNPVVFLDLTLAQWIGIASVLAGIGWIAWMRGRQTPQGGP